MKDPFDDLPETNNFIDDDSQSCLSKYMNYIKTMSKPILKLFKCKCGGSLFKLIKINHTAIIVCKTCGYKRVINKNSWNKYKVKTGEIREQY